jgi:hypothetical protein
VREVWSGVQFDQLSVERISGPANRRLFAQLNVLVYGPQFAPSGAR